ncbi:XK-related protein 8-like [Tachysurus vachellii]|uniref:XK-related protein 8-like n=1 Tax=Tachysurus vachellii TaxID=175792 RepID=UPI00296B0927|nr:XK-related protein 8-like [Tachysurus vachellii]
MKRDFSFWSRASSVVASSLSLILLFWNLAANVWAVVSFHQEQKYFSMGLFLFLILSSSMLLQAFSWLWYTESSEKMDSSNEVKLINVLHILQLGVFYRCLCMLELSVVSFKQKDTFPSGDAETLSYDLSTLGLFKAFCESAPQIVLMMTNIIQVQDLQLFTVIKIISSLSSLSFTVLSYHRSMCTFLADKCKMGWSSSVLYFLWNLFLIGPRVVSVSLFASALPCYIAAHFLSLWTLLVLWAWWQKTDFMDSKAGEWLYRATVGIIWYFSWFNVVSGSTKHKAVIYHAVMGTDTMLLLGLWWWKRSVESARLGPLPINPYLLIALLVTIYSIGVLLKLLYYWKFHPKHADLHMDKMLQMKPQEQCYETLDSREVKPENEPGLILMTAPLSQGTPTGIQKRMRNMAQNFYC